MFVLFCFCFFAFHFFLKPLKFVWVYQKGNFYLEKACHAGKKIRQSDFAPSKKYSSYATDYMMPVFKSV